MSFQITMFLKNFKKDKGKENMIIPIRKYEFAQILKCKYFFISTNTGNFYLVPQKCGHIPINFKPDYQVV